MLLISLLFLKRSTGTEERLSSAISGPSVPLVAVNSLDSNSFHASVSSVTDGNHERSFSPKTSQQFSFDYLQVVSPQKKVEERGSGEGSNRGGAFAAKGGGSGK